MKTAYKAIIPGLVAGYGPDEKSARAACVASAVRIWRRSKSSGPKPGAIGVQCDCITGRYMIVSKLGMTPYGHADTLKMARQISAEARRLGLSGEIVTQ
jgi:hypothetical protein